MSKNNYTDLTGMKFGKLTVLNDTKKRKYGQVVWKCSCECGGYIETVTGHLKIGRAKSCGCMRHCFTLKDRERSRKAHVKIHGMYKTRFYRIFNSAIKGRCTRVNHSSYKNYGGRGIKCLWKSFEEFKKDMYESYLDHVKEFGEKNTQIERIDNDKNYCKENCRWATIKEQHRNRRNSILFSVQGETICWKDLTKKLGINKYMSEKIAKMISTPYSVPLQ
jgi:hypothetical protein